MRLKVFTAPSMSKALENVRKELGPNALIVSTLQKKGEARVTAAVDNVEITSTSEDDFLRILKDDEEKNDNTADTPHPLKKPHKKKNKSASLRDKICRDPFDALLRITKCLERHGLGTDFMESLTLSIQKCFAHNKDPMTLEEIFGEALSHVLMWEPLSLTRPLLLVGPPGSGKTVTLIKLAARAILENKNVRIITTDVLKTGAIEQLRTLAKALNQEVKVAPTLQLLETYIKNTPPDTCVLIDTPGINPFFDEDQRYLGEIVMAARVPPILVANAGIDPREVTEIRDIFEALGANRAIFTRLDCARRMGALLSLGETLNLSLSSASPQIGEGLFPLSPLRLAHLLLDEEGTLVSHFQTLSLEKAEAFS